LLGVGNLTKCLLPINNDGNELQTRGKDAALPILGMVCHHQKAIEALPDVVTALGPLPLLAPHYWHLAHIAVDRMTILTKERPDNPQDRPANIHGW
jgi:hypothetical protein